MDTVSSRSAGMKTRIQPAIIPGRVGAEPHRASAERALHPKRARLPRAIVHLLQSRMGRAHGKGQIDREVGGKNNPEGAVKAERRFGPGQNHGDGHDRMGHGIRNGREKIQRTASLELAFTLMYETMTPMNIVTVAAKPARNRLLRIALRPASELQDVDKVLQRDIRHRQRRAPVVKQRSEKHRDDWCDR